jgi:hypothetical protein
VAIYRLLSEHTGLQAGAYGTFHAHAYPAGISPEDVAAIPADAPATARPRRTRRSESRLERAIRTLAYHWIWLGPLMIVAVGLFDLICTISAFERGWLVEMNPLANAALNYAGAAGLTVYRFVMTTAGCILLTWGMRAYRLRRFVGSVRRVRLVVWSGQAVLAATHLALVCWWIAWLSV